MEKKEIPRKIEAKDVFQGYHRLEQVWKWILVKNPITFLQLPFDTNIADWIGNRYL
jgi:hypothetical protein